MRSETETLKAPAVIRLVQFVKVPRKFRRNVTNVFLFSRDGYCCAYCGRHRKELGKRDGLTRDHVIPQSRFATKAEANTWGNVVTACGRCNRRKADRTPKEAGMPLRTRPTTPHFVRLEWAVRRLTPLQRKYVVRFFGEEVARLMDQR